MAKAIVAWLNQMNGRDTVTGRWGRPTPCLMGDGVFVVRDLSFLFASTSEIEDGDRTVLFSFDHCTARVPYVRARTGSELLLLR